MSSIDKELRTRFILGTIVFIIGVATPVLIPFVANSNMSIEWKTGVSGFLALGIPEIFMLIAVKIMGKPGFDFLKSKLSGYFKPFAPRDYVSLTRHRIGIIMFSTPLIIGWIIPYLPHFIPTISEIPFWYYIIGDTVFLLSFFVLGGNFWDRISGLFKYRKQ